MLQLVLGSNAESSVRKYSQGWKRWSEWAKSKIGAPLIPAQPLSVALYLTHLVNRATFQNQSIRAVETAVYSIRWGHRMAGLPSPTNHSTVTGVLEGARWKLAKPVRPKEPLSEEALHNICEQYNNNNATLEIVRFLFIGIIGYSSLLRISGFLSIRLSDIVITEPFMSISIPKRKEDQHREGHISVLAGSGKVTCPVSITERLVSLLPSQDKSSPFPIVRRIVKTKRREHFHSYLSISYSTALDSIRKFIAPFVSDPKQFGTHSLKSGGASNSGFKRLEPDVKDRHAGWKDPRSKRRYTKRSAKELAEVTKAMSL